MKISKQMTTEKKNNKMILPASAFNSCMIEFSVPDFNETIVKNIISLFLSFSNTECREVLFHTQWFIGQFFFFSSSSSTLQRFFKLRSTEESFWLGRRMRAPISPIKLRQDGLSEPPPARVAAAGPGQWWGYR